MTIIHPPRDWPAGNSDANEFPGTTCADRELVTYGRARVAVMRAHELVSRV